MTRGGIIEICRQAARTAGIPELLVLACAIAESNLDPRARRPVNPADDERSWIDVSGGLFQQTVRFDPEYTGGGGYPGPAEVERILRLQFDPVRSARVAAANLKSKYRADEDDSIFKALSRYNWPAGDGRPFSASHAANYRRGIAEAERLLGLVTPPRVTFDRDEPNIVQNDEWSCSCTALRWALKALGRNPGEQWIEETMLSEGVVSRELGLLDASGAGLAAFIRRQYGEFGYDANHEATVTFEAVAAEIGPYPLLVGLRNWAGPGRGHWTGVRGYAAVRDVLLLANPAGDGSLFGGQELGRLDFLNRGPASLVRLLHPDLLTPAPPPPPPPDPKVRLRERVAAVETALAALKLELGV